MSIREISLNELDSLSFELEIDNEKKENNHYVDNKQLQLDFIKYSKLKQEKLSKGEPIPPLSNPICKAILDTCKRLSYSKTFIGYTQDWKEEMIGDAIETCVRYAHNYNPEKYDNPFAYITKLATNAYFNAIKKEKLKTYVKYKAFERSGGFQAYSDDETLDKEDLDLLQETSNIYDDYVEYIANFEEKLKSNIDKKKIKRKLAKEQTTILEFLDDEIDTKSSDDNIL